MIGRKEELAQLEALYHSDKFEFLVMYGRRRVGKTTLLQEFASRHNVAFYSAQEKNDALNLLDFSRMIQQHFDGGFIAGFQTWEEAFGYITRKGSERRTVLIIDEFPFIAGPNPTIKSMLQHAIDHAWKEKNFFLILCGSSVSFMVNDIMGYQSPLYGRATETLELLPFDYLESAAFFPNYSIEENLISYGILGGIPRYLNVFSDQKTIEENIMEHILRRGAFLNDEPMMLLRMELREPGVYNSILEAIAGGYNRIMEISDHIHEERNKCGKYLNILRTLRLVDKQVPCGEDESSKRSIYRITDNFYTFWYRYIFTNRSYYEFLGAKDAAAEIMEGLSDYMGLIFEDICKQYLVRLARNKMLPFVPACIGKWWGNNPHLRAQDDIDVLLLDRKGEEALFCECKFTNRPMPMEEYDDLIQASLAFPNVKKKHFMFISKAGYTGSVLDRGKREGTQFLGIEDLFRLVK